MKKSIVLLIVLSITSLLYSQNIPNIKLKKFEFKPSTFIPAEYNSADNSKAIIALQRGLWQQEQHQYTVGNKYIEFCKMLRDIYMSLYSDSDLLTWYNEYKKSILEDIESNWKIGNYQIVSQLIDDRKRSMSTDASLLCRLDASDRYENFRQNITNKFSGSLICQWWLETHPFYYEDCRDGNGKVVGYRMTELDYPTEDFPWINHILYIRDNVLSGKRYTPEIGGKLFDMLSSNNLDFSKAVNQSYQLSLWYYHKELSSKPLEAHSDWALSQRTLLLENNKPITPREFYIRKLSSWLMK